MITYPAGDGEPVGKPKKHKTSTNQVPKGEISTPQGIPILPWPCPKIILSAASSIDRKRGEKLKRMFDAMAKRAKVKGP